MVRTRRRSSSVTRKRRSSSVGTAKNASTGTLNNEVRNPRTTELHFWGPWGVVGVMFATVVVVMAVTVWSGGNRWPTVYEAPNWALEGIQDPGVMALLAHTLCDPSAWLICSAWWFLHLFLHVVVPAREAMGKKLRDGTTLRYRINGLDCAVLSWLIAIVGHVLGIWDLLWITATERVAGSTYEVENVGKLAMVALVLSTVHAIWVYFDSFQRPNALLALAANANIAVYDFFMGRELNPRITFLGKDVDLKYFNELRPGMTGWALILFSSIMRHLQVEQSLETKRWGSSFEDILLGESGSLFGLSLEFLLLVSFQLWYIVDSVWFEESILTTVDIVSDGFGFMLSFGDLVWVPFTFSLQARYLAYHPLHLPLAQVLAIGLLAASGAFVFRSANSQKNLFRTQPDHPSVKHLRAIQTKRGTRLLADGWWGMARHINYLGDFSLGLAWCLTTSTNTPITYLYAAYFASLLIHRERRDDSDCHAKYGADWETYRKLVPWRIIPKIY